MSNETVRVEDLKVGDWVEFEMGYHEPKERVAGHVVACHTGYVVVDAASHHNIKCGISEQNTRNIRRIPGPTKVEFVPRIATVEDCRPGAVVRYTPCSKSEIITGPMLTTSLGDNFPSEYEDGDFSSGIRRRWVEAGEVTLIRPAPEAEKAPVVVDEVAPIPSAEEMRKLAEEPTVSGRVGVIGTPEPKQPEAKQEMCYACRERPAVTRHLECTVCDDTRMQQEMDAANTDFAESQAREVAAIKRQWAQDSYGMMTGYRAIVGGRWNGRGGR